MNKIFHTLINSVTKKSLMGMENRSLWWLMNDLQQFLSISCLKKGVDLQIGMAAASGSTQLCRSFLTLVANK